MMRTSYLLAIFDTFTKIELLDNIAKVASGNNKQNKVLFIKFQPR